ncbi:hypothetical protein [Deefgea salmonis]|uniref:DUF3077 domain-containing protein n=1 Tax=Deefgea salmonis TaxID=2875502 RepID=A0ABS8BMA0_9NEIS|nr:hypothetical protein [Deefgea salmonis]MCB5196860.1 hypothetical protein [Deefgea salmonis]
MLNKPLFDLSQEVAISYALTNARDNSTIAQPEGMTTTAEAALRLALVMLQDGFRLKDCEYYSLAALEYLSAVVDVIDAKGLNKNA